jgi:hypothetical protein
VSATAVLLLLLLLCCAAAAASWICMLRVLLLLPLRQLLLHNVDFTYRYNSSAPAVTKFNNNIIAIYTLNTSLCACKLSLCYTNLHIGCNKTQYVCVCISYSGV